MMFPPEPLATVDRNGDSVSITVDEIGARMLLHAFSHLSHFHADFYDIVTSAKFYGTEIPIEVRESLPYREMERAWEIFEGLARHGITSDTDHTGPVDWQS